MRRFGVWSAPREAAKKDQLRAPLLGQVPTAPGTAPAHGDETWTQGYLTWVKSAVHFARPAQEATLSDYLHEVEHVSGRIERLRARDRYGGADGPRGHACGDRGAPGVESLAHRSRTAPPLARRARIILACAEGRDSTVVAKRLRMSQTTVWKWRGRFVRERVDGLYDEPRPGAPRQISDEQLEQVIMRTLEETPRGETHWSSRGMAKASGLGRTTVQQIWRASVCNRIGARPSSCRRTRC